VPARSGGRALCAPECAGHQLRIKYRRWVASERLVFIDETWTKTNMAPLRAWAPRGGSSPKGWRLRGGYSAAFTYSCIHLGLLRACCRTNA
jgi:hypothetical protein